jgi:hypothetical protein
MRLDRIKSGLVWLGLTVSVSGAIAAGGWDPSEAQSPGPPGHDATRCRACRSPGNAKGPTLPYELGADNVRFIYPIARVDDGAGAVEGE